MISLINILIVMLWFLSAVMDYGEFCYTWQLKEYRWDRFKDFLSTQQGKNYWIRYPLLWRSIIAIIILFWPINDTQTIKMWLLVIFIIDLFYNIYRNSKKQNRYPAKTAKAIIVVFVSLIIEGLLFLMTRDWTILLILIIMRFLMVTIVIRFFNLLTSFAKKYYLKQATKKILKYPELIIIGITGSYGKTTVKVFLDHFLSVKFKTVKTPKNINTEIGIAKYILNTNFTGVEIFIVEMGAYRVGDIKTICDMVKPKIGILTAINEQHLSLFGSLKKTQEAKYELLRALPKDGLAITNADNPLCMEYLSELICQVQTFGVDEEKKPTALIKNVENEEGKLKCQGEIMGQICNIEAPIVGQHNTNNIAPCILVALHLGINKETIIERASTLKLPDGVLQSFVYGNCTILDDSYNSNPDGFKAALNLLTKYSTNKKRIIVTRGMLELGEKSYEIHEKIGEEISLIADELVIITPDFVEPLAKGVGTKFTKIIHKFSPEELLKYLQSIKMQNCVILLENKVSAIVHTELTGQKHL